MPFIAENVVLRKYILRSGLCENGTYIFFLDCKIQIKTEVCNDMKNLLACSIMADREV